MLVSHAYRKLSGNALKVLSRVMFEHTAHAGTMNGKLIVTHANFEEYGIRRASISEAIRQCEYMGFLSVERGHFYKGGNESNVYRLTILPSHDGKPATNEWKSIGMTHIEAFDAKKQAQIQHVAARRAVRRATKPTGNIVPIRSRP